MNEREDIQKTSRKRGEQYKDRWTSFGESAGLLRLSERPTPESLRKFDIFKDYDDKFLETISQDVSIAKWKKDTVLFEEGSYIDVAFYIVKGGVAVYLRKQQPPDSQQSPIFDPTRTAIIEPVGAPAQTAFAGDSAGQTTFQEQIAKQRPTHTQITLLSAMDFDLAAGDDMVLSDGEILGEIGALSGWPQSVTARTLVDCELVQIRVPALRLMKRRSKSLKERIDRLYRERSLSWHLKQTPLFRGCDDDFLASLSEKVELISCEPDEIITREGEPADALYVVRSGFVKLSQRVGHADMVVSYLSKGSTLGETELSIKEVQNWLYTASSKEYSELVKISRESFCEIVDRFPAVKKMLWGSAVARTKEVGQSRRNIRQSEFLDAALETGLVEGNSILMIDLNVCTRCDDCVRGCAETHGGIPRFVREGDRVDDFLITRACYHCRDPVCLVGCPTGAIRRAAVGDVVEIDDKLCIGCSNCAENCPYDAIIMYDVGEVWPQDTIPEMLRGKDRKLATKCDLCYTDKAGPACVRSCPQACAIRVGSVQEFQSIINRR